MSSDGPFSEFIRPALERLRARQKRRFRPRTTDKSPSVPHRAQPPEWFLAHLASRPLRTDATPDPRSPDRTEAARAGFRCVLGRETCLQRVAWSEDGWLRLAGGSYHPAVDVPAPEELPPAPWPEVPTRDDFDAPELRPEWQTLRVPVDGSWVSLGERPG